MAEKQYCLGCRLVTCTASWCNSSNAGNYFHRHQSILCVMATSFTKYVAGGVVDYKKLLITLSQEEPLVFSNKYPHEEIILLQRTLV